MRLDWPDVARGAAMMLVVLAHTLQLMEISGWQLGWLDTANLYLTAVRMPLFFLIAGLFGARAIRRTWRGLFASRLALLIYMYVLWMLIRAVWFSFVPWPLNDDHPWVALAISPFWPTNGLWFLFALILYLLVGKLTAKARAWIPLGAALALALVTASGLLPNGGNPIWNSIALYAFFFLLGARLPQLWFAIADRAGVLLLIAALLVVPASVVLFGVLPDPVQGLGRVVLSVVCVAAAIVLAAMVARVRWLSSPFRYVGRRTIAVYVVHAMLLAVLVPLVPVGVVAPVVIAVGLTTVGVCVPLVLYRFLAPVGGVFGLPHPLDRRLQRWAAGASTDQRRGSTSRSEVRSASSQMRSTRGKTASAE